MNPQGRPKKYDSVLSLRVSVPMTKEMYGLVDKYRAVINGGITRVDFIRDAVADKIKHIETALKIDEEKPIPNKLKKR